MLPGGYPQPAGRRRQKGGIDRILSFVFGGTSLVLLFAFLFKSRTLGEVSAEAESLRSQLSSSLTEASRCRSSLNYLEQDVQTKETASQSLKRELVQYREQSDRLDSMLQGYRGQVHNLEVKLSQMENECKKREEELEATVAEATLAKNNAEQSLKNEQASSQNLMAEKSALAKSLADSNLALQRWKEAYEAIRPAGNIPAPVNPPVPAQVPPPLPPQVPPPLPPLVPAPVPPQVPAPVPPQVPPPVPPQVPAPVPPQVPPPVPVAVETPPTPANPAPPVGQGAPVPPNDQGANAVPFNPAAA